MNKAQIDAKLALMLKKTPWEDAERGQWVTEVSEDEKVALSCTGDGRTMRIIVAIQDDMSEGALLLIAKDMLDDPEYWGWVDLDGITWVIDIGMNFHGIPESDRQLWAVADILGIQPDNDLLDSEVLTWVAVHCTDYAS